MASAAQPAAASAAQRSAATVPASRCDTSYLTSALHLGHVTVDSAAPVTSGSYTPPGTTTPITGLPDFCNVALTQADSAGNPIHIAVWLPAKWNGRFQGIGGGGYSCGISYAGTGGPTASLQEAVDSGYAGASTDCGVPPADGATGSWALPAAATSTGRSSPTSRPPASTT